jgi:hypothetical protein
MVIANKNIVTVKRYFLQDKSRLLQLGLGPWRLANHSWLWFARRRSHYPAREFAMLSQLQQFRGALGHAIRVSNPQ